VVGNWAATVKTGAGAWGGASSGGLALAVATTSRLELGVLGGLIADGYREGGEGGPVVVGGQKSSGKKNHGQRKYTGAGSRNSSIA
jgi:hypothetical protein